MEIQTTKTILIASFLFFFVIGIIFTIVFIIVASKIMERKEARKIKGFGEKGYYPKNLEKVYRDFPSFNVFNTFIVDDAPGNIKHEINKENCLLIQPFAPFSVDKVRRDLGEEGIDIALNDTILEDVENISHIVKTDIGGCSIEDIEECFTDQPVFSKKRIKRMGLGKLLKKYTNPPIYELLTIGNPKQSKKPGRK